MPFPGANNHRLIALGEEPANCIINKQTGLEMPNAICGKTFLKLPAIVFNSSTNIQQIKKSQQGDATSTLFMMVHGCTISD